MLLWGKSNNLDRQIRSKIERFDQLKKFVEKNVGMNTIINESRLEQAMKWFVNYVITKQGNSDISFMHGWLKETEGYKYEIYSNAHNALDYDNWDEKLIGTGEILSNVLDSLKQKSNKNFNNIVQYQSVTEFKVVAEKHILDAERILFNLYTKDDPSKSFDEACKLWGKRFPELSYLLFMKDREKYLPVKTTHHMDALSKLGIDTTFLKRCSWDNYVTFLDIHKQIRQELKMYLGMEISLLDVHSFVWVMQHASDDLSNYDSSITCDISENDDPLVSTVINLGKEGRITYHYVAKYERKPQNRNMAIKIHGCRCMACGFDFEKVYGEYGKDYIEVHHIKPLFSLEEEMEVDPEKDLICLCANCHRMVHKKRGAVLSLEKLKDILKSGPYIK